jgi:hypothetical protein
VRRHPEVPGASGAPRAPGPDFTPLVLPCNGQTEISARAKPLRLSGLRRGLDRLIKLHVATWHAGPHFVHDECLFVNLENLDTKRRDFHAAPLGVECRYRP